ncbi:uncharacterized protein G2W53_024578 [Senna tora]|uniref:Uncharacterized protein n=1 Tax=Senna tora TaxID=362788 RepID=A0A834WFL4_9FABA|nr:uncharacterized protein G2W53_024578 [Senna tora]
MDQLNDTLTESGSETERERKEKAKGMSNEVAERSVQVN